MKNIVILNILATTQKQAENPVFFYLAELVNNYIDEILKNTFIPNKYLAILSIIGITMLIMNPLYKDTSPKLSLKDKCLIV